MDGQYRRHGDRSGDPVRWGHERRDGATWFECAGPGGLALDTSFGTDGVLAANVNAAGHDRFISVASAADGSVFASGFYGCG